MREILACACEPLAEPRLGWAGLASPEGLPHSFGLQVAEVSHFETLPRCRPGREVRGLAWRSAAGEAAMASDGRASCGKLMALEIKRRLGHTTHYTPAAVTRRAWPGGATRGDVSENQLGSLCCRCGHARGPSAK